MRWVFEKCRELFGPNLFLGAPAHAHTLDECASGHTSPPVEFADSSPLALAARARRAGESFADLYRPEPLIAAEVEADVAGRVAPGSRPLIGGAS